MTPLKLTIALLLTPSCVFCEPTLYYNILFQKADCIKEMLYKSKDLPTLLHTMDDEGFYPLDEAVRMKFDRIARILLLAGADPTARNRHGSTALHIAARIEGPNILPLVLIKCDNVCLETRDSNGETALMAAVSEGRENNVQLLLLKKADVNALNAKTMGTVMHVVRDENILRHLRGKGVILDARDGDGNTPIISATKRNDFSTLTALLNEGCDPNAANHEWKTALHYAIEGKSYIMVRILLKKRKVSPGLKINIYAKDKNGQTPLDLARRCDEERIMEAFEKFIDARHNDD